ncbi:MAG TPA: hypothetical protein VHT96_09625 [Clostridia bacterium]|nr:hypothetical protein [Clostridia bacterium]
MKRFVFIYLISFILCVSSLAYCEEMPSADVTIINVDATTEAGDIFIPDEGMPGGSGKESDPADIISIYPSSDDLLAAPAAAAGSGGYMVMTVTPESYNMGELNSGSTYTYTGAVVLSISTKSAWNLQVSGTDFNNGTYTIPVSRIKCKVSTSSEYITLSSTPINLLTNQSKAWPTNATVQIDYQITVLRTDPAGTNFQNNLTFSLY